MKKVVSIRLDEECVVRLDELVEQSEVSRADFIANLIYSCDGGSVPADDVVQILKGQLEEKDSQINQLLEQSRNYQVLLKQEQDKLLPPKRVGFFQRLFGNRLEG